MRIGILTLMPLLIGLCGCDVLNGDGGSVDGAISLLRNGSFESWQDSIPSYWNVSGPFLGARVSDAPPGGGNWSAYVDRGLGIQAHALSQSVRIPDSAQTVTLSFWARGSHGPVYFQLKTPTTMYTSDTLINFYQSDGWYQYSTFMSRGMGRGDSITVILSGSGRYDLVRLTTVH